MPIPPGAYYRIRTYPSGKRVRILFSREGRALEAKALKNKAGRTRTGKRLTRRRRRIYR